MTSRNILLVGASLCAALAFTQPASAQSDVPLRASYQGQFLPDGTEIVVLSKEGRIQRDGRYQPEFFPTRDFPRSTGSVFRRDRLSDTGRSNRSYAGTQTSGRLYFIYALTPDSTLYWSYSAQRDSLKYDVVSTGVMSVAPVPSRGAREEIVGRYFRPRVTVVMREEENGKTVVAGADSVERALHRDSLAAAAGAKVPAVVSEVSAQAARDSASVPEGLAHAGPDSASTPASVVRVASATPVSRSASSGFSPLAFWGVIVLLFGAGAVPAYLARTYRKELQQTRRENLTLRSRASANEEAAELRASLADAELRCQQLEDDYAILEARYAALQTEMEALHTEMEALKI